MCGRRLPVSGKTSEREKSMVNCPLCRNVPPEFREKIKVATGTPFTKRWRSDRYSFRLAHSLRMSITAILNQVQSLFLSALRAKACQDRYPAIAVRTDFQHEFRVQQNTAKITVVRN
jgi:hypothetical protein